MRNLQFSFFLGVILVFTGCKSSQKVGEDRTRNVGGKKTEHIVEQIRLNEKNYPHSISFKANVEFKAESKSTSFKTTIRMVSDSAIWISVTAYGYEAARILATPDSLKFVSRTEKKFYEGNYDFIERKLGVEFKFKDLQDLLMAHSFGLEDIDKINRTNGRKYVILSSIDKRERRRFEKGKVEVLPESELVYTNWVNPDTYRVEQIELFDIETQTRASIEYTAFENIDSNTVLSGFKMRIIAQTTSEISADFSRIEINQPMNFPFKVTEKYEPIQ